MAKKQTKFIFVTGGVLSGVGKGIAAASLGAVLKSRGYKVNIQKCDPYLNMDAGTLNPGEHGEVFVTDDGAETDLDLGHYERFLDRSLSKASSMMAGQVFGDVIEAERRGDFLGKTVQIVPHIVEEIKKRILEAGKGYDVHIAEIGGTVGDYEGLHFMEAIRRIQVSLGSENTFYVHVVFLPYLETSKEVKTRPAQYSTKDLRELGINPQMIIARSDHKISKELIEKLSFYCGVEKKGVIPMETVSSVYKIPSLLEEYKVDDYVIDKLGLPNGKCDLKEWHKLTKQIDKNEPKVKVGLVAKYLSNSDTYASVIEAIKSASWNNKVSPEIVWIDAEKLEKGDLSSLEEVDGLVVPGGFGSRGIEGKILAAKYARENNVPYFGLCLGMQIATIEFARSILGWKDANSEEFNQKSSKKVIHIMPEQRKNMAEKNYGASMRLGAYPCVLDKASISYKLYGTSKISERHRHRYEFNNDHREEFVKNGMLFAGLSPDHHLVEIVEIPNHKFYVGVQFHPEFKSRPLVPHPLFNGFIKACVHKK